MLSRLPLSEAQTTKVPNAINIMQIDFLPLTADKIRDVTSKDMILKYVVDHLQNDNWPNHNTNLELKPYYDKRHELSLENGIILWGLRVTIPAKY